MRICRTHQDYRAAGFDPDSQLLEEFVEGPIYFVDGVHNAQGVVCVPSRYMTTCHEHFNFHVPMGGVSIDDEALLRRIERVTEKIIAALPLRQGIFHLELIHSGDDELVFLEIACRVGGTSYDMPRDVFGVDLIGCHIRSDLMQDWALPRKTPGVYGGILMLNHFEGGDRYFLGFDVKPLSRGNRMYKAMFPLFGRKMNAYDGSLFSVQIRQYGRYRGLHQRGHRELQVHWLTASATTASPLATLAGLGGQLRLTPASFSRRENRRCPPCPVAT